MSKRWILAAWLVAACGGDDGGPSGAVDAAVAPDGSSIDATNVDADLCGAPASGTMELLYTGDVQLFEVPSCITTLHVEAYGAQGGAGAAAAGGLGGRATATIPVTPGETLRVYVGGAGNSGGYNGGGGLEAAGGAGAALSGRGGGATDIRRGETLADRLIVAGGGGGACGDATGAGGAGGALEGEPGIASNTPGGGGGTQSAGGAVGFADATFQNEAGALGIGGECWYDDGGCGAGGGGYYGGGAGGFGGGGGGSSFISPPGVTIPETLSGVRAGDGRVVLTW